MKSAGHDTCYGKNPFPCKRLHGFSANGAAPRGGVGLVAESPGWICGVGRAGGTGEGRREPIPGGLAAASMPRTPSPAPPARPMTHCGGPPATERKKKIKSKSSLAARFIASCRAEPCSAHEQAQRRDPLLIFFFFSVGGRPPKSVRGRSGWVRGGVSRMDAADKPPGTDSRRPLPSLPARTAP